jgi:hypothetical protein
MTTQKTCFTFTSDKQFRDNIIYQDLEGNQFQREYLVLGRADNHAHAIELGEKAGFPLVAGPHEALPLFSYDHHDPAVHPELRGALKYDGYRLWTAKVDPSNSGYAWYVDLNDGFVLILDRYGCGLAVGCRVKYVKDGDSA